MSFRDNLRKTQPYVPGEQPRSTKVIKLNTNESPYPPSPGAAKALKDLDASRLRLYPPTDGGELTAAIAEYYGVEPCEVFVGVGSDDVLAVAFQTFFCSGRPVIFPDITYSFYDVWASLYGVPFKRIPLDEDFRIRKEDYYGDADGCVGAGNGGVILANPNAPTSIAESLSSIEDIAKHNPDSVVVIDEAYIDFGGESALPLLKKYENLVIVRTFSKSRQAAGLRVGFAIAGRELIDAMNAVKFSINSYTMSYPVIAVGKALIEDDEYFKSTVGKTVKTRERIVGELEKIGFSVLPSSANFVFASHERVPAKEIFEKLRARDIYVRYFDKPRIDDHLRITIGTDEQMDVLIEELKKIVGR
ncbi:MAG: histidinol-phosphate transaminase [Lachnospiraceae bacterium]|nr:histidinol-phosphate transaminase [Lachnospiraceae bacterium]